MRRSTFTIGVMFVLSLLLAPGAAWAGKKKPAMCEDLIVASMNQSTCDSRSSNRSAYGSTSGNGVGWNCRLKGDDYDQYRRVQNKSSLKSAETFFTGAAVNGAVAAFSFFTYGSPVSLISSAITSTIQYDNLTTQQKLACERLELEIENKKKQIVAIAKIGKDMSGQVQQVASNLGKQITVQVQGLREPLKIEIAKELLPLLLEELKRAGVQFKEPTEGTVGPPDPEQKEVPQGTPEQSAPAGESNISSIDVPAPEPVTAALREAVQKRKTETGAAPN